jgi:hypothetical protein
MHLGITVNLTRVSLIKSIILLAYRLVRIQDSIRHTASLLLGNCSSVTAPALPYYRTSCTYALPCYRTSLYIFDSM